jgi:hypothetical protein
MRPALLRVATFLEPVRYADGLRLLEGLAAARAADAVPDTVLVLEVRGADWAGRAARFLASTTTPLSPLTRPPAPSLPLSTTPSTPWAGGGWTPTCAA